MAADNEVQEKNTDSVKQGEESGKGAASDAFRSEFLSDMSKGSSGSGAAFDSNKLSNDLVQFPDEFKLDPPKDDKPNSPNETWYMKGVGAGGEGDHKLSTGDRLQRDKEGNEILTTPDGSKLTVNKDGTYKTEGNVTSVEQGENGERTVTFADGSKVKFGPDGIRQVSRGHQMAKFINPGANLPKEPSQDPWRRLRG